MSCEYPRFDDDDLPDDPPQGFKPYEHAGPFSSRNGPFYFKKDADGGHVRAFRVRTRHCNGAGVIHGGCLMAFADGILGYTAWNAVDGPTLTITMNSDFLSIARPGDWVEGKGEVIRATKSVVFVKTDLKVGHRTIFHAQAIFKVMRARRPAR